MGPAYIERYAEFSEGAESRRTRRSVSSRAPDPFTERRELQVAVGRTCASSTPTSSTSTSTVRPQWFFDNVDRYDSYPRTGPKVFAGEYAAHTCRSAREIANTWEAALAEAACMTGLERNADVVGMSSYAPLFAHVDAWQWTPDLIWFDNLRSFGTPNYYVQQLFGPIVGTRLLTVTADGDVSRHAGCSPARRSTSPHARSSSSS